MGLADYQPGDSLVTMPANPHAVLYAVYGNEGANRFVVQYITNGHYRAEHYLSGEDTYTDAAAEGFVEGFKGWSLTEGGEVDYLPGDALQLKPAVISKRTSAVGGKTAQYDEISEYSLELYAVLENPGAYQFTVHYDCGNGLESVTRASSPTNPVIYFVLDGPEAMQNGDAFYADIIGWSEIKGGPVNYAVGATLTMQYNVPEKTLYAVRSTPLDEEQAEDAPVWSSADESIVTVDAATGAVTAVGLGTTYVNVEWKGEKASIPVSVSETAREPRIPLSWDLTNDGVKAIESKQIPSNAIVTVRWPAPEVSGGDEDTLTQYFYVEDMGWMTIDQLKEQYGEEFGDWIYTEFESKWE